MTDFHVSRAHFQGLFEVNDGFRITLLLMQPRLTDNSFLVEDTRAARSTRVLSRRGWLLSVQTTVFYIR
jgi:hypothetical protein